MLLQPALCDLKVEDAPVLLCLGGQGSFLLNNTSPGRQTENPRAQLTLRFPSSKSSGVLGHISSAALLRQFPVPQPWCVLGLAEVEHFSVTLWFSPSLLLHLLLYF